MTSVSWGDIADKPTLATVATSGSYNDLIDKPSLEGFATKSELESEVTTINSSISAVEAKIPDTSKFVTTDTEQTITGNKVFTGTLQAASLSDGTTTKTMTEVLSGGGGSTTYMHSLKLINDGNVKINAWANLYTKSETPFDKDTLTSWFIAKGLTNILANGVFKRGSYLYVVTNIKLESEKLYFGATDLKDGTADNFSIQLVEDTVVAID